MGRGGRIQSVLAALAIVALAGWGAGGCGRIVDDGAASPTEPPQELEAIAPSTTLVRGEPNIRGIGLNATDVFFITDAEVKRVPKGGGDAVILATGAPSALAVGETAVFWTDRGDVARPGRVMMSPSAGGSPIPIAEGIDAVGLAVDRSAVYWIESVERERRAEPTRYSEQHLWRFPHNAEPRVELESALGGSEHIGAPLIADGKVYYAHASGETRTIRTAYLGIEKPAAALADYPDQHGPLVEFALDAGWLYFVTFHPSAIWRVSVAGGLPVTVATPSSLASSVAVRGADIYFGTFDKKLQRVGIRGGVPTTIARSAESDRMLCVVDDARIYWTDRGEGAIKSAPR